MAFYKGTNVNQDGRFMNADKKLIEKMETPPEYKIQIHKSKINLSIIKSWINKKLNDILGFEDEALTNYIINLIEEYDDIIDPKNIQYSITGFLDDKTYSFMEEFWKILISAQNTINGIPDELIEEKKKEIIKDVHNKYKKMKFLDDLIGKKEININSNLYKENEKDNYSESKKYKRNKDKYRENSRDKYYRESSGEKYYRDRSRDKYDRDKYYREKRRDKYDKRDYHYSHHHRKRRSESSKYKNHSHSNLYKREKIQSKISEYKKEREESKSSNSN